MTQLIDENPRHWPTLQTVLMVEQTMQEMDESLFSVADVKRALPRKVNHETLKIILKYLEESNKIAVSIDGITWIFNASEKLAEGIRRGRQTTNT